MFAIFCGRIVFGIDNRCDVFFFFSFCFFFLAYEIGFGINLEFRS